MVKRTSGGRRKRLGGFRGSDGVGVSLLLLSLPCGAGCVIGVTGGMVVRNGGQ